MSLARRATLNARHAPSITNPAVSLFIWNLSFVTRISNPAVTKLRTGIGNDPLTGFRLYWQAVTLLDEQILISTFELLANSVHVRFWVLTSVMWPPSPAVPTLRCFESTRAIADFGDTRVFENHQTPLVVNVTWLPGTL